ncbi:MAG: cytochrome b/b6 domain-containing protein [Nitrososphaerales archaeon]
MDPLSVLQSTILQSSSTTNSSGGRLPVDWAAAIVLFFIAIFAVHFVRRAYRQPPRSGGTPVEVPGNVVKAFDLVERLFHWALFMTLGLVMVSGIALYFPGSFNFILQAFGVAGTSAQDTAANLLWHTDMLWLLLGLIVIHVIWDLAVARSGKLILPYKSDVSDTWTRMIGFFGFGPKTQPRHGKYDAFMKLFHWGLVLCLVLLGVTGLYLWSPYGIMPSLSPSFENTLRLLHDIFAFLLVGLVAGHVYFAVLPVNWPVLRSIFTGTISGDAYNHDIDSSRWPLKKQKAPAPAPAPQTGPAPAMAAEPPMADSDDNKELEVK